MTLIKSEHEFAVTGADEVIAQFVDHFKSETVIVINLSIHDCVNTLLLIMKRLTAKWTKIVDLQADMTER